MPDNQQFVTRADLGADFNIDDVGDKLTVRNVITGAGPPVAAPSVQTKPWIYVDMTPDPAELYAWDTVGLDWEAAGGTVAATYGITLVVDPPGTVLVGGDGRAYYTVPAKLNGKNLTDAQASVPAAPSAGGVIQLTLTRIRGVATADMMSTIVTIDDGEDSSYTSAAPSQVNAVNDDLQTGDFISVDVSAAGTNAEGLQVIMMVG